MAFDPDAYIDKKSGGFDPDAYLEKKEKSLSQIDAAKVSLAQGITGGLNDEIAGITNVIGSLKGEGLPTDTFDLGLLLQRYKPSEIKKAYYEGQKRQADLQREAAAKYPAQSMALNIGGSFASPINYIGKGAAAATGAIQGGISGFAEGEGLEDSLKSAALGAGIGAAAGFGLDKASKFVQPVLGKAKKELSGLSENLASKIAYNLPKENADEIISKAKELGIEVTPAMLTDSNLVKRLEEGLAESPTIFSKEINRKRSEVLNKLKSAVEKSTEDATQFSRNKIGQDVQSGIISGVAEKIGPSSMAFQEVAESTKYIPLSKKSIQSVTKNIESIPTYRLTEGAGKPSKYVGMLNRAESADDIKQITTLLNQDLRSKNLDSTEKYILGQMKDKLSRLEENSIMRSAIEQAKESERDLLKKKLTVNENSIRQTATNISRFLKGKKTGEGQNSYYYELPNGKRLRVSDHNFPRKHGNGVADIDVVISKDGDIIDKISVNDNDVHLATIKDRNYLYEIEKRTRSGQKNIRDKEYKFDEIFFDKNSELSSELKRSLAKTMSKNEKGKDLVSSLKSARNEYRKVATSLGDIARDANIKVSNPMSFVDAVEKLRPEEIQDKFFSIDNLRLLENFKKSFPKEFDLLRQGKIKDIADAAVDNTLKGQGEVSAARFLKEIRKLDKYPEAKSMIFSSDALKTIDAIDTINKAIPEKFFTSPTPRGMDYRDLITAQVSGLKRYLLYKGATSDLSKNVSSNVKSFLLKVPKLANAEKENQPAFNALVRSVTSEILKNQNDLKQKPSEKIRKEVE